MASLRDLFCTILAKEKTVQGDNRYVLLNTRLTSKLSQSFIRATKVKLICRMLFMHSAIEQQIYCTFRGILWRTVHYQRWKQLEFNTVDVTVARLLLWLRPQIC